MLSLCSDINDHNKNGRFMLTGQIAGLKNYIPSFDVSLPSLFLVKISLI